jgi:allantoinase
LSCEEAVLDIAIKGGTVVNEDDALPADVGIEGDRIAVVAAPGSLPPARQEIDAEGLLVLPGIIDIHFHVRAPGHPERGTFETETQAAAAGGVTTLLEMPISVPGCARRDILENRRALGEARSYINFGLYGAAGLLDRDEILGMAEAGACAFKVFTHATPVGREDEFLGICIPEEDRLYTALECIRESGLLTVFHAENDRLINLFEGRMRGAGRRDPAAFAASRPPVVEAMSIAQIGVLCEAVGTPVHIAHVSGDLPLQMLRAAQARGLPMTGETCPHYLALTVEALDRHGPYALIKPPMRTLADQQALWQGLRDGALCAITTDHSPFTVEEKERGRDDIWRGAIGTPGVELLVPYVLTQALNGSIALTDAVRWLCSQPARLFRLYPRKGVIRSGADADLTIYNPVHAGVVDTSTWLTHARAIGRVYDGIQIQGKVSATFVNGRVVYEEGRVTGEPGWGRFVRPAASTPR